MIQIKNTLISFDLIEEMFRCDLAACRGMCCVEGDAGAPVEREELALLEAALPVVWNDLSEQARKVITQQGAAYLDREDEYVTSIVDGKDCVFTCYDNEGICRCALEKAYQAGAIHFQKPISCHLYPIRVVNYKKFLAINYHTWSVCRPAVEWGRTCQIPVYQFLKDPLIRKFGADWYEQLEAVAKAYRGRRIINSQQ